MDTPNYFETVVTPALQQKCQELFNYSLMLETNLRIESAKVKDLQAKLVECESKTTNLDELHQKVRLAESREAALINTLRNTEQQAALNLQAKAQEYSSERINLEQRYSELQQTYSQLSQDYLELKKTIEALNSAPVLKTPEPKVVKALKGKVQKVESTIPPVMSEPDDF